MEPNYYIRTPFIIFFLFLFCFNSTQAVCKPRNLNLRYLTVLPPPPNSPPNWQPAAAPSKPQLGQFFPYSRPTGPSPRAASAPSPTTSPTPNPSSQPSQSAPPPAGNSVSPSPSLSSFLRGPDIPKDSPRWNLIFPNSASSSAPVNPAIQQICKNTDYPDICVSSLTPFLPSAPKTDPLSVLEMTIKACTTHAKLSLAAASKLVTGPNNADGTAAALSDCKDLYSDALDGLKSAMDAFQSRDVGTINSMLSGVVTNAVTCGDGFEGQEYPLFDYDDKLRKMASNCLAIASLVK